MSDLVKVGSLLPQGITLRIAEWYKGPDGAPLVKDVATHTIAGSGKHIGYQPGWIHGEGAEVPYTEIPADHWESWLETNKDSDLVTSGAVFKWEGKEEDGEGAVTDSPEEPKPISPLPPPQPMGESEMEKVHPEPGKPAPEPTPAHDEMYATNYKDEPNLRGMSKDEIDAPKPAK